MILEKYDVVVVGGGIAGIAAAVRAGRMGSRVLLVEQYGFLGGSATAGMVSPFMKHTLDGQPLVAGVFADLENRMREMKGMIDNGFSALAFRMAAFQLLAETGVRLYLDARLLSSRRSGRQIESIDISFAGERRRIKSRIFIDTSGDAQLLFLSGLPWVKGDERNGRLQAMTLFFRMIRIDMDEALSYVRKNPPDYFDWMTFDFDRSRIVSVAGYFSHVRRAIQEKRLPEEIQYIFYTTLPESGEASFNTSNILGLDGSTSEGLTQAELAGRDQVQAVVRLLQQEIPGFAGSMLLETATQVGVRETRRAVGDYVVTGEDILGGSKFEDRVARGIYGIDIHGQKDEKSRMEELQEGMYYDIPRRALIVKEADNVLVAGRCISATREGHGALRIMPTSAATGEACGAWAALAVSGGLNLREVPVRSLQSGIGHNIS